MGEADGSDQLAMVKSTLEQKAQPAPISLGTAAVATELAIIERGRKQRYIFACRSYSSQSGRVISLLLQQNESRMLGSRSGSQRRGNVQCWAESLSRSFRYIGSDIK